MDLNHTRLPIPPYLRTILCEGLPPQRSFIIAPYSLFVNSFFKKFLFSAKKLDFPYFPPPSGLFRPCGLGGREARQRLGQLKARAIPSRLTPLSPAMAEALSTFSRL